MHGLLGNKGKEVGKWKEHGGWVMKRKEIGWLLGDKGERGVYVCIDLH